MLLKIETVHQLKSLLITTPQATKMEAAKRQQETNNT
jgi:hypothetical protein